MTEFGPFAPDPFRYRAIWGVRVDSSHGFDLLVARQLIWLPHAKPAVRQLLYAQDEQPICPACAEVVAPGSPSIVGTALLADRAQQEVLAKDPAAFASRSPDSLEAWWLVHGSCFDALTEDRIALLNQRIELALRTDTRFN
ncbi:MAG: hypothetical protein EXR58_07825 [Chloroflexi bacterium]|nr:hypothetical protein [Chloroflexota bacterium]